jgi:hypothetical protein
MIEAHSSLNLFFYEIVHKTVQNKKIELQPDIEYYLVDLLSNIQTVEPTNTLVDLQIRAEERKDVQTYKVLGDCALTKLSIFDELLSKRGIKTSYVKEVGCKAYRKASVLGGRKAFIFHELGSKFELYAEVLEEVKEETALGCEDPLKLYERYLHKKSPSTLKKLTKLGLVLNLQESET